MQVDFICVPYSQGRYGVGMGKGPNAILDDGFAGTLEQFGHAVEEHTVICPNDGLTDIQTIFKLDSLLSQMVTQTVAKGALPIILAGDCIATAGAFSGLHDGSIGVLWLDSHADFNTPETTESAYIDGMALSVTCGRCWKALTFSASHIQASEDRVALLGARDIDPGEVTEIEASRISVVTLESLRKNHWKVPELDRRLIKDIYMHFDADVLDVRVGRANKFSSEGGLRSDDVDKVLATVVEDFNIRAMAITAYDPQLDTSKTVLKELRGAIHKLIKGVSAELKG